MSSKRWMYCGALLGLLFLGGCGTAPSGGQLPPAAPEKSDEEARKAAYDEASKMMSKMSGVGGVPAQAPKGK